MSIPNIEVTETPHSSQCIYQHHGLKDSNDAVQSNIAVHALSHHPNHFNKFPPWVKLHPFLSQTETSLHGR